MSLVHSGFAFVPSEPVSGAAASAAERWEVSISHDARGYPAFYINGLSGAEKHDAEALKSMAAKIAATPLLLEAAQKAYFVLVALGADGSDETATALRAAIQSATGEG